MTDGYGTYNVHLHLFGCMLYAWTQTQTHEHKHRHTNTDTRTQTHKHRHTNTDTQTHEHKHRHTNTNTWTQTHEHKHRHTNTNTDTQTQTQTNCTRVESEGWKNPLPPTLHHQGDRTQGLQIRSPALYRMATSPVTRSLKDSKFLVASQSSFFFFFPNLHGFIQSWKSGKAMEFWRALFQAWKNVWKNRLIPSESGRKRKDTGLCQSKKKAWGDQP